ncbi:16S rRNA (uracil(1498)-N(3))-methyltransferase [Aquibacillus albus]|uniref:Ribosomal RNA small subunit methyltransferase E n=1 Tax=Aquibacillus albus TaxID=1168171 RepID=A0ABS2MUQ1_9BACI|nr:16S rRNA (uracil1498-N3)-methyltransferase [Aquibacillus albus]
MQRYFIAADNWKADNHIVLSANDYHHITRVMRMTEGDKIICNHPYCQAAICVITNISNEQVIAAVEEWLNDSVEMPVNVTVAQGLPKGDKFDLVLQKGTELGASAFLPFEAKRSVVKWDSKKAKKKLERFNKIVKEASEQAHRNRIPSIEEVSPFQKLLEKSKAYDVKLVAYEEETRSEQYHSLGSILKEIDQNQSVLICIGPEGGFTLEEINALKEVGFYTVRLGPRILRTETAALYFLSSISYHFEELEW